MTRSARLFEAYAAARAAHTAGEAPPARRRRPGEIELQAGFYAGDYGLAWTAVDGGAVEIIHPGEWNREPGPDFVGARVRVDGVEVCGDIEMDGEDLDWERHGHVSNPAFDEVVLHVFFKAGARRYHTRTSRNRAVIQVVLPPSAPGKRGGGGASRPCGTDPEAASRLIEAGAHFRMARKRERWLRAVALHGLSGALFQSLASGMGYKNNAIPFLLTAQRTGLERARGTGGEALLFGIAGFLEARRFDAGSPGAREYARELWDAWWKERHREGRLMLPREAWNFAALRPANHPHRRLGALAAAARNFPPLLEALETANRKQFLDVLSGLDHPFWKSHGGLGGRPFERPCALVGSQRAVDLAANVLAPAAGGEAGMEILRGLRSGSPTGRVRRACAWLGLPASWPRREFQRQGLLQVYEDFHHTPAEDVLALEL